MEDFSIIYVDLSKTTSAPPEVLDDNGAVICNDDTLFGTPSYQLTYEEMRVYLIYRATDRTVEFRLKNKLEVEADNINHKIFTIQSHSNITITNQIPDVSSLISINTNTSGQYFAINVTNSNLNLHNIDIEIWGSGGVLQFISPYDMGNEEEFNTIHIENCRFWNNIGTDYISGMIRFENQREVYCVGNVFSDKNDTYIVRTLPVNTHNYLIKTSFIGNIFYNIINILENDWRTTPHDPDYNKSNVLYWNIFNADMGSFLGTPPSWNFYIYYNFIDSGMLRHTFNQFSWVGNPSICNENLRDYDIIQLQDKFYYLDPEWETATPSDRTLRGDFIEYMSSRSTYGERDGRGALVFPPMDDVYISYTPRLSTIGDTLSLSNSTNPGYDNEFQPIAYRWFINEDMISTIPSTTYDIVEYGEIDIELIVYSHNYFYTRGSDIVVYSLVDKNDVSIDLKTTDIDGNAKNIFNVNETVYINVENTTDLDNIISNVDIIRSNGVSSISISNYLDVSTVDTSYNIIRDETIIAKVYTTDNRTVYFSITIDIQDAIGTTYYVDLSTQYESDKWLELNYGIYDDFENGSISQGFYHEFISNYSVVPMYDELVANGTIKSYMIKGILQGDFKAEWSFVRTSEDDIPSMSIEFYILGEYRSIDIEWDFVSDSLLVYDEGTRYRNVYGKYTKDMDCPDTIHKINIFVDYDDNTSILDVKYNLDIVDDTTQQLYSIQIFEFDNTSISINGTDDVGLGYVGIQANSVDQTVFGGEGNGSINIPFTYSEMYNRVSPNSEYGNNYDRYLCRNWRVVSQSEFIVDDTYNYHIDVWDPHKYGPWMLVFDEMNTNVFFGNTILSNGIMYNIPSRGGDLIITTLFDMFITWNGNNNRIGLARYTNRHTGNDVRCDLIGSTIKSEGGFYSIVKEDL